MVSATATTLASTRRKLRLAAAATAAAGSGVPTSAVAMPSPTLTTMSTATASPPGSPARTGSVANDGGSRSLSPVTRSRMLRNANIAATAAPQRSRSDGWNAASTSASESHPQQLQKGNGTPFHQHRQLEQQKQQLEQQKKQLLQQQKQQLQQQQHEQQQPMQAPLSASNGEGPITSLGNSTNRGRPRRSRAVTRRGAGVAGGGDGRGGLGISSSSSNRGQPIREEEQEYALSSMSSSAAAAGGGGDNPNVPRAHQMLDAQHRHRHHIHRTAHHNVDEQGHCEEPHPSSSSSSQKLALNLHVAHSVDSDDNGTCFNSIGTTTSRQPSPRHVAVRHHAANAGGGHGDGGQKYQPDFHEELRLSDGESSAIGQQRLLPSNTNNHRWNGMKWNSSDQLSPLQEHGNAASSASSNSSSYAKNCGKSQRQQVEFASTQNLTGGGAKTNNISSIWDRPEEMVSKSNNSSSRYKPSDNGPAYSEFDREVSSFHGQGVGRSGWGSYNAQHARRGSKYRGEASVASNSQVDQENEKSTVNTMRVVRGEPPHRDLGSHKSSVRRKASILPPDSGSENRDGTGKKDAGADDTILNRTNMKTALGVCTAATIGAVILGPVGLLVGAASVAIGMGVMQIPEEQRNNMRNHAATSLERARDLACDVGDSMSASCAKYTGTDPTEIVGKVVPNEIIDHCGCFPFPSSSKDGENRGERSHRVGGSDGVMGGIGDDGHSLDAVDEVRSEGSSPIAHAVNGVERGMHRLVGDVFWDDQQHHTSPVSLSMNLVGGGGGMSGVSDNKGRGVGGGGEGNGGLGALENEDVGRRVACGRKGRVVPLSQIHSLRPSLQPRAWLDVMASAHTTRDDKNEAMQEILILAKDKDISRWFLEEGILDSLMFILSNYFRNYSSYLRMETPMKMSETEKEEPFSSFKSGSAFYHAKLAANCCVALGRAHCAAVHTEGDLLLMSAYSRGSVPIERQLAQMLFEVPHHMKVMNPSGGNSVGESQQQFDAEFTLTELSMQQAEDLASSIKALDEGKNILAS